MNRQHVTKWDKVFKDDRTHTHDEKEQEDYQSFKKLKTYDCRVTLNNPHEVFPHISRTLLGENVTEKLGYKNLGAPYATPKEI